MLLPSCFFPLACPPSAKRKWAVSDEQVVTLDSRARSCTPDEAHRSTIARERQTVSAFWWQSCISCVFSDRTFRSAKSEVKREM